MAIYGSSVSIFRYFWPTHAPRGLCQRRTAVLGHDTGSGAAGGCRMGVHGGWVHGCIHMGAYMGTLLASMAHYALWPSMPFRSASLALLHP